MSLIASFVGCDFYVAIFVFHFLSLCFLFPLPPSLALPPSLPLSLSSLTRPHFLSPPEGMQ